MATIVTADTGGELVTPPVPEPFRLQLDRTKEVFNEDEHKEADADPLRQWVQAKSELEVVDDAIRELRRELGQLEEKREAIMKKEQLWRQEAKNLGSIEVAGVVEIPLTARDISVAQEAGSTKPAVYEMAEDADGSPTKGTGDSVDQLKHVSESTAGGIPLCTPRLLEDWERGLDASVAKCGVCGMKFPLDMAAIERHSMECEGAKREGRRPTKSDFVCINVNGETSLENLNFLGSAANSESAVLQGEALAPTNPTQKIAVAGAAVVDVVAGAGSLVGNLAAAGRAWGEGIVGGGGYPTSGLGALRTNVLGGGIPLLTAGQPPPSTSGKAAVGDRAAILRSRMQQRSRSSQPSSSRSTSLGRWRK